MLQAIERFLGVCERLFLAAANLGLAAMLGINLLNILSRALFERGLSWVFPWTSVLFVWLTFLGFYVVYRRGKDVTIDFIIDRMGSRARYWSRIFVDLVVLLLMGVLLWEAPDLLRRQVGNIEMVGFQRYWLSVPLFVSSGLIALHILTDLARLMIEDRRGRAEQAAGRHVPAGDI